MTVRSTRPFFRQGAHRFEPGDEIVDVDVAAKAVALGLAADDTDPPTQGDAKDAWVAYRTAQGHDVEGLTKQALIDLDGSAVDEPTITEEDQHDG